MVMTPWRARSHARERAARSLSSFLPLVVSVAALQLGCSDADRGSALEQSDRDTLQGSSACAPPALGATTTPDAPSEPKLVYAANQNSHDISTFSVAESGQLTALGEPIAVGRYPEALALHPNGLSLFV